jgi:hypothetical protein
MGYVGDAFDNLKHALEITDTEQKLASARRQTIYDLLTTHWDLTSAFLTGSYGRRTKTKRLKDVDIFAVIDPNGDQKGLRQSTPSTVLDDLKKVLEVHYPGRVTVDVLACAISFGSEDIMSFEVVPAFERSVGGYEIPDMSSGRWIPTNPTKHADQATAKNKECGEKWIPLVKMLKGMNRQSGEPISPSFLIEVMALSLILAPFGPYQDEIAGFLASASDRATDDWGDPAKLGPAINRAATQWERQQMGKQFRSWQMIAEAAIDLEDNARDRAAVDKWRELFGDRMPRPE